MSKMILRSRLPSEIETPEAGLVAIFADASNSDSPSVKFDNGAVVSLTSIFTPTAHTGKIYVDNDSGDDATGSRNNPEAPFETLGAAITAAVAGDLINVRQGTGTYDGTGTNLIKNGVTIVFEGVGVVNQALLDDLGAATVARIIAPGWTFNNTANVALLSGDSFIDFEFDTVSGGNVGLFMNPSSLNNRFRFIGKRCFGSVYGFNARAGANGFAHINEIESNAIAVFFRSGATQFNGEFHVICPNVKRPVPLFGSQHIMSVQTTDTTAKVKLDVGFKDAPGETNADPVFLISSGITEINMNIVSNNRRVIDVNTFQATTQGKHKWSGFIHSQDKEAIYGDRNGRDIVLDDMDILVENAQQAIVLRDPTCNLYIKKARIRNNFVGGYGIRLDADPNVVLEDCSIQADAESISAGAARNIKVYRLVQNVAMNGVINNTISGSSIIEDAGVELEMQLNHFSS